MAAQNLASELLSRNSGLKKYTVFSYDMPMPSEPTPINEDRDASWDEWDLNDAESELKGRYIPAYLVDLIKSNHNKNTARK